MVRVPSVDTGPVSRAPPVAPYAGLLGRGRPDREPATRMERLARLGPKSLGPASRFVVDRAPCPVLLIWPEPAPGLTTIPPPPPHPPHEG